MATKFAPASVSEARFGIFGFHKRALFAANSQARNTVPTVDLGNNRTSTTVPTPATTAAPR